MTRDFQHQDKDFRKELQYFLESIGLSQEDQKSAKDSYQQYKQDGGITITITQIIIKL